MTDDELDRALAFLVGTNTVDMISIGLMTMMHADPALTFASFERRLRTFDDRVFLLARPARLVPPPFQCAGLDAKPSTHAIWIALNGPEEQAGTLDSWGMTQEENSTALTTCGFMVGNPSQLGLLSRRRSH